ncbi:hypothetical protein [Prevotella multiformis]|uniref:hypothetical protein n=1 Tax=Prevotella multiformis TaxID=282402 RepID=UPI0023EF5F01|nr:hypothetical protein [Prevotella multiformis]
MGMILVLAFWAVAILLLSLASGLLTLPFSCLLCKRQRKRKMLLCFLTPGTALCTYAAGSFVCMVVIAVILGTDIGIGDSWSAALKNHYELASTGAPENGGICRKDDPCGEVLVSEVTHLQVLGDSVIGKADGSYFIFNLKNGAHTDSLTYQELTRHISPSAIRLVDNSTYYREQRLTYQELTRHISPSAIRLVDNSTYYREQRKTAYAIAGVLCLLLTALSVWLLWRIGLHGFQKK